MNIPLDEATRSAQHREATAHLPPLIEGPDETWLWTEDDKCLLRLACARRFGETLRTESLFCIAATAIRIAKSRNQGRD